MRARIQLAEESRRVVMDDEPWPVAQLVPFYGLIFVVGIAFWSWGLAALFAVIEWVAG